MEKLLLRALLAGDELDVVDEQDLSVAVFISKVLCCVCANRLHQIIGEGFGGDIEHAQSPSIGGLADSVEKVGFAQPYTAIDKERIISASRRLRHSLGSGLSQAITRTDDKIVKRVDYIQARIGSRGRRAGVAPVVKE